MKNAIMIVTAVSLAAYIICGADVSSAASDKAGGNLRYTISVSKFQNKSGWSGQWDVGDGFGS
ncbi:MAG: hypothetical protein Q8N81_03125, partial [bacterium]|nr:hypothetical protein [bacterium]